MKLSNRKVKRIIKKTITLISIIFVVIIFLFCSLCIVAKLLPDSNTDVGINATVDDTAIDTTSDSDTSITFATNLKKILVLEDFAYTALGAMFGFGASLILENYILNYSKRKAFTNLADEIIQLIIQLAELRRTVLAPLSEIPVKNGIVYFDNIKNEQDKLSKTFRLVRNYKDIVYLPIWESILQNGDLLYFREENYFSSLIKVYTRLIKIKHLIDDADIDKNDLQETYDYLNAIDMNIKEFLTIGNDFEESLIKAIDNVNKQEENYDYKNCFEVGK